ncbi:hypothetical protein M0R45_008865 [Rubus argutus]|uniref:Uncharacterized protein n=1 Tax=Rubus argutus TaxID=59490 RepID=A0AAW1Y3C5_RUBAR
MPVLNSCRLCRVLRPLMALIQSSSIITEPLTSHRVRAPSCPRARVPLIAGDPIPDSQSHVVATAQCPTRRSVHRHKSSPPVAVLDAHLSASPVLPPSPRRGHACVRAATPSATPQHLGVVPMPISIAIGLLAIKKKKLRRKK